jgi:hypothetical protein
MRSTIMAHDVQDPSGSDPSASDPSACRVSRSDRRRFDREHIRHCHRMAWFRAIQVWSTLWQIRGHSSERKKSYAKHREGGVAENPSASAPQKPGNFACLRRGSGLAEIESSPPCLLVNCEHNPESGRGFRDGIRAWRTIFSVPRSDPSWHGRLSDLARNIRDEVEPGDIARPDWLRQRMKRLIGLIDEIPWMKRPYNPPEEP